MLIVGRANGVRGEGDFPPRRRLCDIPPAPCNSPNPPGDREEGALRQWRPNGALRGYERGRESTAPLRFWDNRCTQHNPVNDYHGYRSMIHRVTVRGDKLR